MSDPVKLEDLARGDEIILRGTIDTKGGTSVEVILDGDYLGRVVRIPGDVMAVKTGESPNYGQNPWHGEFPDLSPKERKSIYNKRTREKAKRKPREQK